MDQIKKFLSWLATFPVWARAVIVALVAGLFFLITLTSCGQTVRVTVKDTPAGVSISTSQHKADSSGSSININPTINFPR